MVDYQAEGHKREYGTMIQQFNRFLLEEMSARSDVPQGNPHIIPARETAKALVTQLMGIDALSIVVCGTCGSVAEKDTLSHVVDLAFARKVRLSMSYFSRGTRFDIIERGGCRLKGL